MHHRRARIIGVTAGRAGAIFAAQGQVHVVPARVILTDRCAAGIQYHDAVGVSDVDAVVDLVFRQTPDVRRRLPLAVGLEQFGPAVLIEGAGLEVIAQDFRHQVGGVDQGFFRGLAHPGTNFFHHGVEHEVAGQADEQHIDQENP
ncbi:hypothetical protein D3C84_876500 [compost metagenome]